MHLYMFMCRCSDVCFASYMKCTPVQGDKILKSLIIWGTLLTATSLIILDTLIHFSCMRKSTDFWMLHCIHKIYLIDNKLYMC